MSRILQRISPTPAPWVIEWDFASDLKQLFLPRILISGILGGILGFSAKILDVSSLGYAEMAFAGAFWVAALMVATFKGHAGHALFWLLLMEAGLTLYQVSIYSAVLDLYVWVRLGPALLGGILFFATFRGRAQQSPFLYIAWIVCNLPSLMSGAILGAMDPLNSVLFWAFNVLYPLAFYFAIGAMRGADLPQCMLSHFVSITVLALCLTPVLLIPIELTARQTTSFTELQFGGRAYAVIGAVTLTAPALLTSMSRRRMLYQAMSLILIILLFASSFSRGGLVTFALLALGTFAFGKVHRGKLAAGGLATILFLVAVGWYFIPETIGAIGWFWLLRMNVVSNLSDGVSFDAASIFDTGRSHIWDIASSLSMDSPFWGYGVGSTPSLLFTASGGEFRFSGMHNMLLTILVERGFLGLLGALVVLGRIGYLVYRNRNLPVPRMYMGFAFLLFLVFANSTGVEFFQNSTRSLNANITVILIVLIGYLEYDPKILPHDERFDLASEMTDNGGVA